MTEEKPKRTRKSKEDREDEAFASAFGLAYGFFSALAHMEAMAQILGRPHDIKACIAGAKCAIHGKQFEEQNRKEE